MAACLEIRIGDTLSYAGKLSLPAGQWSAICSFSAIDAQGKFGPTRYDIDVVLSLVGPDAADASRNIWVIQLQASSVVTATWPRPASNASAVEYPAAIKFYDNSTPPLTRTSKSFKIKIFPPILS